MTDRKLKPLTEYEMRKIEGGSPALLIASFALGISIGNTLDANGWLVHRQTYRYGGRLNLRSAS